MILDYYEKIKLSLQQILSFKTVMGERTETAPFGEENAKCLQYFLNLAQSFGFETQNVDNYAGHVDFGEGELFSILCHLDVVPCGNDWTKEPFSATFENGNIYGRGIMDNKGQAIAILYCFLAMKNAGIVPNKKFRLIVGCNEESGWKCMEYYQTKYKIAQVGFSPDGDFPLINVEKGVLHLLCKIPLADNFLLDIKGGERVNMVADYCQAKYLCDGEEKSICKKGISAHGSHPEMGQNAILKVLNFLSTKNLQLGKIAYKLADYNGNNCNLAMADVVSGSLSLNVGTIDLKDNILNIGIDIRYPICGTKQQIVDTLKKQLGCEIQIEGEHDSHYVDQDLPLVKTLLSAYNQVMQTNAKPLAIGGATYARILSQGVAFGPAFPNSSSTIHSADEFVSEEDYKKMLQIYYLALCNLSK